MPLTSNVASHLSRAYLSRLQRLGRTFLVSATLFLLVSAKFSAMVAFTGAALSLGLSSRLERFRASLLAPHHAQATAEFPG